MLKIIFLLGLMTMTVSGRLYNNLQCRESDGRCCTARCPPEWRGYDGRCYYVSEGQSTFRESQRYCAAQQADLVTVSDEAESDFLKVQIATLARGCPTQGSVLRKDVTPQLCYWLSDEEFSHPCAENYCQQYGGELVSVPDDETLERINCEYRDEALAGIWTSITYDMGDARWEDVDGNEQTYLPWDSDNNEPSNTADQVCLRIRRGLFHDEECATRDYALCQIPVDTTTWIGVTDATEEGTYRDLNGREIKSQDQEFAAGGPTGGADADCVGYQLQSGEYSWEAFNCHEYNNFICEYDPDCVN